MQDDAKKMQCFIQKKEIETKRDRALAVFRINGRPRGTLDMSIIIPEEILRAAETNEGRVNR